MLYCQRRIHDFPDAGRQPLNWGAKPLTWQDLCRKLHENERNWTEKGAASLAPPGSANACVDPTNFKLSDITSLWNKNQPQNYQIGTCLRTQKENVKVISHIILPESLIPEMFSNFYENLPFFPKQDVFSFIWQWRHHCDERGISGYPKVQLWRLLLVKSCFTAKYTVFSTRTKYVINNWTK